MNDYDRVRMPEFAFSGELADLAYLVLSPAICFIEKTRMICGTDQALQMTLTCTTRWLWGLKILTGRKFRHF